MKKLRFNILMTLLTALCLCIGQVVVAAEATSSIADWDNDNAIFVEIRPDYIYQVLEDVPGAFATLDLKASYITTKYEDQHLGLLLVLSQGGKTQQEAAIAQLRTDERISYVYGAVVPFETVNTLYLSSSADTIEVGDTLTLKQEGILNVYEPSFSFEDIELKLSDYDAEKEYTPADFPQFEIASVEKMDWGAMGIWFSLKIAQPGYFNILKAVNAFASDPAVQSVNLNYIVNPAVSFSPIWTISDPSVADFTDKEIYIGDGYGNVLAYKAIPNENGEVTVKGLKPGKVTISYVHSLGHYLGTEYEITYEITVTEANVGSEHSEAREIPTEAQEMPTEAQEIPIEAKKMPKAPKTSNLHMTGWVMLSMFAAVAITVWAISEKTKRKDFI